MDRMELQPEVNFRDGTRHSDLSLLEQPQLVTSQSRRICQHFLLHDNAPWERSTKVNEPKIISDHCGLPVWASPSRMN